MSWNTHIPKFRRFVLQNFPFIEEDFDALTDYALICKVVEYLNQVITSQNEVVAEVGRFETDVNNEINTFETNITNDFNRLEGLFNDLKSFVDNYFDNLDVQEEINNKLEEMAEDGTLQEIITTYIQSNVAWSFDTVAEMKQATNLVDGSYAQTLGFYSINDGGGALYKIRQKEENETANNITTFEIGTTNLVAELNRAVEINILQCGAKKDGSASISTIVNYLITNYPTTDIYVPNGDYLVHETIYLGTSTQFRGENMWQTRLFTDADIVMIQNKTDDIATLYMSNFYIDGNYHATKGVYIYRTQPNLVYNDSRSIIRDLLIKKCTDWCMQIGATTGSSNVIEITIENVYAHQYTGGGIYIAKCSDSHFSTLRAGSGMNSNKPGIQVEGYNLQFINCKAVLAGSTTVPASGWYFNGGGNIHADIEAQANTKNGVEIKNTRNSYFNIIADANCLANNNEQAVKLDNINACVVNAIVSNNVDTQGAFHTDVGCKIISPVKSTISLTCDNNIPKCVDLSEYNTSQVFAVNSKININGNPVVDVTPEFNESITVPTGITLTKINNGSFLLSGTSTTDQNIWIAGSYGSHTVLSKLSSDCIYDMTTGNSKVGLAVWNYVTNLAGGYDRIVEGTDTDVTAMMIQIKANTSYNHVITPKVFGLLNKPTETFA